MPPARKRAVAFRVICRPLSTRFFLRRAPIRSTFRARNVDLMGARLKKKRVDNGRHMTRNATARFRAGGMMRMRGDAAPELAVTPETHLVGISPKFHGREVV